MTNPVKRHRILISAYACEPNKGSEPGVGWNWSMRLSEYYDVYVITRENNRQVIEQYLTKNPNENINFFYHDCSKWMRKIKKLPGCIFLYYKQWQREILPIAETIIRKEHIELVHHVTFNEFRTPGKLYKLNVPYVWGPVGGGQFYNRIFRGAYFSTRDIVLEKIRNFVNRCYLTFSLDIKNAIRYAATVLIADQSTESILPKVRIYQRMLETAVDTENIQPKKEYLVSKNIKLLWVGGIWPRKGLKILIDALGESDFRDFTLDIIGDGRYRRNCEKLVKRYHMQRQVIFRGKLSFEETNATYSTADVFVFSSMRDTSGNVVLEAMAHGLPVITLKHHGVGEIVTKSSGIPIEVTNLDEIKAGILEAVKTYYTDRKLIRTHGIEARHRIEESYSWDRNVQQMAEIYEKILKENDSGKI